MDIILKVMFVLCVVNFVVMVVCILLVVFIGIVDLLIIMVGMFMCWLMVWVIVSMYCRLVLLFLFGGVLMVMNMIWLWLIVVVVLVVNISCDVVWLVFIIGFRFGL